MDDRNLQELLHRASTQAWEWAPECPDEHEIAAYVDGTIRETARHGVELHLADCERCTLLVGALSRLEIEATGDASAEVLERARRLVPAQRSGWTRYLPHFAAAACVVLAVTLLIDMRSTQPNPTDSGYRTTRGVTVPASLQVTSPASGAGVSLDELDIHWTDIPGTRYYLVRIVTASGALVTEQRMTETHWRPGSAVRLTVGEEYYVRVEAYPAVGPSIGSIHVPFTVRSSH